MAIRKVQDVQLDGPKSLAVDRIRQAVNSILLVPLLQGVLVQDVDLADGLITKINHGLGRQWLGWLMVDLTGATTAGFITSQSVTDPTKQIALKASGYGATINVSIWVF